MSPRIGRAVLAAALGASCALSARAQIAFEDDTAAAGIDDPVDVQGVAFADADDDGDPDLYLTVTYANMGAMDNIDDKADPVVAKLTGGHTKEQKGVSDRNAYRTILGTELVRELKIK